MKTVMELMQDAIQYEEALLAHAIMLGIRHGKWKPGDSSDDMDFSLIDSRELQRAKEDDLLGMKDGIKLYSSPLGGGRFAIIFAKNEGDARAVMAREVGKNPKRIDWLPYGMDVYTTTEGLKDGKTWRRMKEQTITFPALAGIYQKEQTQ